MRLYPLKFNPIYKEKVWGGRILERLFGRVLPAGAGIGESWDVSERDEAVSRVGNGPLAGKTLRELIRRQPVEILGSKIAGRGCTEFPLLIKWIDAEGQLSVQVHPTDLYAAAHEAGERGKTELWYIAHAEEGAELICGFESPQARDSFARVMGAEALLECLKRIKVKTGDAVFVPAGRVHSIGSGILIFEVGQNSDLTYRIYDWERGSLEKTGRPLHLQKALDVIDFADEGEPLVSLRWEEIEGGKRARIVDCAHFSASLLHLSSDLSGACTGERFKVLSVVEGKCAVCSKGDEEQVELSSGDTVLLPAALGKYRVSPGGEVCRIIQTEVP